jgi:hypothetical protein
MNIKVGDRVEIPQGIGKVAWIRPQKIPQLGNINLPLVNGPEWEMGVVIKNPPDALFPCYVYYVQAKYAKLVDD